MGGVMKYESYDEVFFSPVSKKSIGFQVWYLEMEVEDDGQYDYPSIGIMNKNTVHLYHVILGVNMKVVYFWSQLRQRIYI